MERKKKKCTANIYFCVSVVSSRWPLSCSMNSYKFFTFCHFPQKYGWIFYCTMMVCEIICSSFLSQCVFAFHTNTHTQFDSSKFPIVYQHSKHIQSTCEWRKKMCTDVMLFIVLFRSFVQAENLVCAWTIFMWFKQLFIYCKRGL